MSYIYSAFSNDKLKYINELISNTEYCFFLIGSSGNGKNFLMRKIGEYFKDSTYFFCSYDSSSLDGVLVNDKVLIFDSVYPHNVLPTIYKVNGEIVDLGSSIIIDDSEKPTLKRIFDKEKNAKNEYIIYGNMLNKYMQNFKYYFDNIDLQKEKAIINNFVDELNFDSNSKNINVYFDKELDDIYQKYSISSSNILLSKYLVSYIDSILLYNKIPHITYHNIYNESFVDAIRVGNIYIGSNLISGKNIDIYGENILNLDGYSAICNKASRAREHSLYLHKKLERTYKPYINFDNNEKILNELILKIKKIIK